MQRFLWLLSVNWCFLDGLFSVSEQLIISTLSDTPTVSTNSFHEHFSHRFHHDRQDQDHDYRIRSGPPHQGSSLCALFIVLLLYIFWKKDIYQGSAGGGHVYQDSFLEDVHMFSMFACVVVGLIRRFEFAKMEIERRAQRTSESYVVRAISDFRIQRVRT